MTQRTGRLETLAHIGQMIERHTQELKGAIAPPLPPPTVDQQLLEVFGGPAAPLPQPPSSASDEQINSAF